MSEELGKIEKPSAEGFKGGRKLYFIPLIYSGAESPAEYLEKYNRYWEQVEKHLSDLQSKLGGIDKIYHELIAADGEEGSKAIRELNDRCYQIVNARLDKGAKLLALEKAELLTEFMDWSRCLAIGLQNQQVFTRVYESYTEAGKKRNEYMAGQIDETLKENEIGILLMREGYQVQFPQDIQVFYIAPPALDEIKRWLRDHEAESQKGEQEEN